MAESQYSSEDWPGSPRGRRSRESANLRARATWHAEHAAGQLRDVEQQT